MWQVVRKQIRSNTSVEFYDPTTSVTLDKNILKYFFQHYIMTGKHIDVTKAVSEDGLTQTITVLWESQAAETEFTNDSMTSILLEDGQNYRSANGISLEMVSSENI
jgi:hypothetical protein